MENDSDTKHEREPSSRIAEAISFAISSKGDFLLPRYDIDELPPRCTEKDLVEICKVIRELANEEDGIGQVYISASTSEGFITQVKGNLQYRNNPATSIRIVVNAFSSMEMQKYKRGLSHMIARQLEAGVREIVTTDETVNIVPLAIDEKYFGAIKVIKDEHRLKDSGKTQFGLEFDVLFDEKIKDPIAELDKLLKLNNPQKTKFL